MRRSPLHMAGQMAFLGLQSVSLLPNRLFDNPQLGHINALPFVARVGTRQSFAGVWILDHPNFVPDDTARIELVEDESGPALGVAIDRGLDVGVGDDFVVKSEIDIIGSRLIRRLAGRVRVVMGGRVLGPDGLPGRLELDLYRPVRC